MATREELQAELLQAVEAGNFERIYKLQKDVATILRTEMDARILAQGTARDTFKARCEEELQAVDVPVGYRIVGQVVKGIDAVWRPASIRIEKQG